MNPLIGIFKARIAHFQLQVLLAAQMNTKIVKQSVIQEMTDVFHDEINLMKRTPNAHELGLRFMINLCYYTNMSSSHRVLAIDVESNNLKSPTCIQHI